MDDSETETDVGLTSPNCKRTAGMILDDVSAELVDELADLPATLPGREGIERCLVAHTFCVGGGAAFGTAGVAAADAGVGAGVGFSLVLGVPVAFPVGGVGRDRQLLESSSRLSSLAAADVGGVLDAYVSVDMLGEEAEISPTLELATVVPLSEGEEGAVRALATAALLCPVVVLSMGVDVPVFMGVDHADLTGAATVGVARDDELAPVIAADAGALPDSLAALVVGAELVVRLALLVVAIEDDAFLTSTSEPAPAPGAPPGPAPAPVSLLLLPAFSFCGRSRQLRELLPLSWSLSFSRSCLPFARADWTVSHGPSSSGSAPAAGTGAAAAGVAAVVFVLVDEAAFLDVEDDDDAAAGVEAATTAFDGGAATGALVAAGRTSPFSRIRSAYEPSALKTEVVSGPWAGGEEADMIL